MGRRQPTRTRVLAKDTLVNESDEVLAKDRQIRAGRGAHFGSVMSAANPASLKPS